MILAHVNLAGVQSIFHPDSPIGTSESTVIKATFFGMTVLTLALGVVVTRMIGPAVASEGN